MIVITGDLAAMKSTLAKKIGKDLNIVCLIKDHIKEILGDTIGYQNRQENLKLSVATFELMYHFMIEHLSKQNSIILESNLREHEFVKLKTYAQDNNIEFLTFFLTADPVVLYDRFKNRHIDRHHVHASIGCPNFDDFKASMFVFNEKFYGPHIMFIDTSKPDQIPYDDMLTFIKLPRK
jgi:predicted kinase